MQEAGITHLWLPPPSQSVAPQGYLPGQVSRGVGVRVLAPGPGTFFAVAKGDRARTIGGSRALYGSKRMHQAAVADQLSYRAFRPACFPC